MFKHITVFSCLVWLACLWFAVFILEIGIAGTPLWVNYMAAGAMAVAGAGGIIIDVYFGGRKDQGGW